MHNVFTEKNNKVALSFNDEERLQSFNRVRSYPYGKSAASMKRRIATIC